MKEPKNHRPVEAGDYSDYEYCAADGDEWPCKKWRKWTASKDYRIQELEADAKLIKAKIDRHDTELRETREKLRRLELLVRGGVLLALRDAGHSGITEEVTRDVQDYTMAGSSRVHRVAGREDYTVTYTGRNTKYVNGELTEAWSP